MNSKKKVYFDWVDALKAFAILGILLNHLLEEFGPIVWFTNPSENWPDLATRLQNILPEGDNWLERMVYLLGWLGDSGPGVFILLSGFGLTLSAMQKSKARINSAAFFERRLKRIFPLYVAIHFLTLVAAFFIFRQGFIDLDLRTLLSFLGLRFTDHLFFYINPSWWFIWIVLQLYLVFPLLYRLMRKTGLTWFFILTLGFTILSRGAGIEGIRYSNSLYFWMTGIFFGTRLAEFTLGMVLAAVLLRDDKPVAFAPRLTWFLPLSLLIYFLGLTASVFWAGTLISNLLVTVGLSGLFYVFWQWGIKGRLRFLKKPLVWIGVNSFGVFLLHQAPMMWTSELITGTAPRFIVALFILVLSFPMALGIERFVGKVMHYAESSRIERNTQWGAWFLAVFLIGALVLLELFPAGSYLYQLSSFILLGLLLAAWVMELKIPVGKYSLLHLLLLAGAFAASIKLFVLSSWNSLYALAAGFLIAAGVVLFYHLTKKRILAWALSLSFLGMMLLSVELLLRNIKPLETPDRWGEYPALEAHPTRIYGLKPSLDIRLRYNNYNYRLKTNSQGLASPEITPKRPDDQTLRVLIAGDAFSMPEGLPYEMAYPFLLEKLLRKALYPRTVQVINGGVTGYGPNESLPQIAELVPLYQPDVVIYQFFINEFAEVTLDRETRLRNIGLISDRSALKREIVRSQILAYKEKYEQLLIEWLRNRDSHFRYFKSLLAFYEKDTDLYQAHGATAKVKKALSRMKEICVREEANFLVAFVPGQVEVSDIRDIAYFPRRSVDLSDTLSFDMRLPFKKTAAVTDSLQVSLLDLTPALKSYPEQPVYFPGSWHWNKKGHRAAAQTIFEAISNSVLK